MGCGASGTEAEEQEGGSGILYGKGRRHGIRDRAGKRPDDEGTDGDEQWADGNDSCRGSAAGIE